MKAEHLMIGNYVKPTGIDFGDRHREINQIHLLQNNQYIVYFKSYPVGCYLDKLEPIPLDEEWLVKFGCIGQSINRHKTNYWNKELDFSIDAENTFTGDKLYYYLVHNQARRKNIQYVHELQQLYLALTGTPLTIKTESK